MINEGIKIKIDREFDRKKGRGKGRGRGSWTGKEREGRKIFREK